MENTLLDGSPTPQLKICDFGYSKVDNLLSNTIIIYYLSYSVNYYTSGSLSSAFFVFLIHYSPLYYTHNQNRLLGHQHILHRRFYHERSTMARYLSSNFLCKYSFGIENIPLYVACFCLVALVVYSSAGCCC